MDYQIKKLEAELNGNIEEFKKIPVTDEEIEQRKKESNPNLKGVVASDKRIEKIQNSVEKEEIELTSYDISNFKKGWTKRFEVKTFTDKLERAESAIFKGDLEFEEKIKDVVRAKNEVYKYMDKKVKDFRKEHPKEEPKETTEQKVARKKAERKAKAGTEMAADIVARREASIKVEANSAPKEENKPKYGEWHLSGE